MKRHILSVNDYLRQQITAYYDCEYLRSDSDGPDIFPKRVSDAILMLKNQFGNESDNDLFRAKNYIRAIATTDLGSVIEQENISSPVIVCVPRSKASFTDKQLFFRRAISEAAQNLNVTDGSNYIRRTINTKTTHLANTRLGDMGGDGNMPYPGITARTCKLMGDISGKDIILVDDIYTKTVNIDEDCCQYLLDNGAKTVIMYTICKTRMKS